MTRRELLLASMFFLRCTRESPQVFPDEGRLHARPDLFAGATQKVTPQPQRLGLSNRRDGMFYVPRVGAPSPLLLFLHGATQSGAQMMRHLTEHANRTGTIVIAPDSRQHTWGFDAEQEPADLAFIDDALERIFTTCRVDPNRIGIAGFSDGASAALSWGLVNGDFFTAIAAFSPGFVHLSNLPTGTPRIFISHGTSDSVLPVERCGRRIARELRESGYTVEYREFDGDHEIPPEVGREGLAWAGNAGVSPAE
jgi:phospholipase/carboxylesterase